MAVRKKKVATKKARGAKKATRGRPSQSTPATRVKKKTAAKKTRGAKKSSTRQRKPKLEVQNPDYPKSMVTPWFRVGRVSLFQPKVYEDNDNDKSSAYEIQMLFNKDDTDMKHVEAIVEVARQEKFGNTTPRKFWNPIRDGDTDEDLIESMGDVIANHWVVKAKSYNVIDMIDQNCQEIVDTKSIYPGCWGVAKINSYPYDKNGGKGVSIYINSFRKMQDDEKLQLGAGSGIDELAELEAGDDGSSYEAETEEETAVDDYDAEYDEETDDETDNDNEFIYDEYGEEPEDPNDAWYNADGIDENGDEAPASFWGEEE